MEDFLKFAAQYGITTLISVVVVYGMFEAMRIALSVLKERFKVKKHNQLIDMRKLLDAQIQESLERLVFRTNASRAYVFEYHNGMENFNGVPFIKMSNTYEITNTGVRPVQASMQAVPTSLFAHFICALDSNDYVLLDTHDWDDRYKSVLKETLVEQNVHKAVCVKITNADMKTVGFAGLDYVEEWETPYRASHLEILRTFAIELGVLLSI